MVSPTYKVCGGAEIGSASRSYREIDIRRFRNFSLTVDFSSLLLSEVQVFYKIQSTFGYTKLFISLITAMRGCGVLYSNTVQANSSFVFACLE